MFRKVKNNYKTVAICKNGDKEGTYTFIESYDDDWSTVAATMFFKEFGIEPTEMHLKSREKI